jgi:hypothetical protein
MSPSEEVAERLLPHLPEELISRKLGKPYIQIEESNPALNDWLLDELAKSKGSVGLGHGQWQVGREYVQGWMIHYSSIPDGTQWLGPYPTKTEALVHAYLSIKEETYDPK